jgi:hypothetical protein
MILGRVLKVGICMAWDRADFELVGTTTLDQCGLRSRAKFHKQYRRNGIPTSKIATRKYAVMAQVSLRTPRSMMRDET